MILLDHCTPRRYLRLLQLWGYTADITINHIRQDATDSDVIALAQALDAVLLTVDLDFANILDYPPEYYGGIIVLRYQANEETMVDKALRQALDTLYREGLRGVLVIVSAGKYRIRHPKG
jgi:predicted nuclease of predicted toxin-antitoxin system